MTQSEVLSCGRNAPAHATSSSNSSHDGGEPPPPTDIFHPMGFEVGSKNPCFSSDRSRPSSKNHHGQEAPWLATRRAGQQ